MKNCHFSIIYNEYNFLTQKLPFLYKYFDQIIFYDLNVIVEPHTFSIDGSHEYIKNFPDPEKKITLIEKKDLSDVSNYHGASVIGKQKMFAEASKYVNDDIDIFWCTDMDEFFSKSLFNKVNNIFESGFIGSINVPCINFWKNTKIVFVQKKDGKFTNKFDHLTRISSHKKNDIYGHCNLQTMYDDNLIINGEYIYHFSVFGITRMEFKLKYLTSRHNYMKDTWHRFNIINNDGVYGYPIMHPNNQLKVGIQRYTDGLPEYIDEKIINSVK